MKLNLPALSAISLLIAMPAPAAEQTINLLVPGMSCPSCPYIVEAVIGDIDGVLSVITNPYERSAVVVFDDALTSPDAIRAASANAGYEALIAPDES